MCVKFFKKQAGMAKLWGTQGPVYVYENLLFSDKKSVIQKRLRVICAVDQDLRKVFVILINP